MFKPVYNTDSFQSRGRVLPVLPSNGILKGIHAILSKFALLSVGLQSTSLQMGLEVVENGLVTRDHHTESEGQKPPVQHIDPAVGIWRIDQGMAYEWVHERTTCVRLQHLPHK